MGRRHTLQTQIEGGSSSLTPANFANMDVLALAQEKYKFIIEEYKLGGINFSNDSMLKKLKARFGSGVAPNVFPVLKVAFSKGINIQGKFLPEIYQECFKRKIPPTGALPQNAYKILNKIRESAEQMPPKEEASEGKNPKVKDPKKVAAGKKAAETMRLKKEAEAQKEQNRKDKKPAKAAKVSEPEEKKVDKAEPEKKEEPKDKMSGALDKIEKIAIEMGIEKLTLVKNGDVVEMEVSYNEVKTIKR